jgi:hypothetical protein
MTNNKKKRKKQKRVGDKHKKDQDRSEAKGQTHIRQTDKGRQI